MNWMTAKALFSQTMSLVYDQNEITSLYRLFLEDYLQVSPHVHLYTPQDELNSIQMEKFNKGLSLLNQSAPIQYLTQKAFFCDLNFKVNSSVLIPRPETEDLVRIIYDVHQKRRAENLKILDLGTGSGCIAIALKSMFKKASVIGVDISQKALDVAKYNAEFHKTPIDFVLEDLGDYRSDLTFDIIVSNPPYVLESEKVLMHPNVLNYEPEIALFVQDNDPLKYYKAIVQSINFGTLKTRSLFLEINPKCLDALIDLMKPLGAIEIHKDLSEKKRFIEVNI
ncbi:MAG: peptide chain release factor N(5)-glutamine methyltransferase [Flavobacteriaceae bacterium]